MRPAFFPVTRQGKKKKKKAEKNLHPNQPLPHTSPSSPFPKYHESEQIQQLLGNESNLADIKLLQKEHICKEG